MNQKAPTAPLSKADENGAPHKIRVPAETISDPLLECLSIITKLFNQPQSLQTLVAGLPMPGNLMNPSFFLRAAKRIGFEGRMIRVPLASISSLTLPCVLLLKDRKACVLVEWSEEGMAEVIFPETAPGATSLSLDVLNERYQGAALFIRPGYQMNLSRPDMRTQAHGWFWREIAGRWYEISQVILASVVINILTLSTPLFVMNVYDRVVPNHAMETLWVLAIGVSLATTFDFILKNLRYHFIDSTGRNLDTLLSSKIFEKIMRLSLNAQTGSPGALANRVRSFESLRDFFSSATLVAFVDVPFAFIFIALIYYIGGLTLAILPLTAAILIILLGYFYQGPLTRYMSAYYNETNQKQGFIVEIVQQLETIKFLGVEGLMQNRWELMVDSMSQTAARERRTANFITFLSGAIGQVSYIGVIVTGVYRISEGEMTMGGLIACSILNGRVMAPLMQITGIFTRMQMAKVSLTALNQLMLMPEERPPERQLLHRPEIRGDIEFRDVFFRYPGQHDPLLKNLSLDIKTGERIGIIGPFGSGKSSILKLVMGLYPVQAGSVLLDGTDVQQLEPAESRSVIGHVPQDNSLFSGTIRENVSMGGNHLTDREIMRALAITGFDRAIRAHPMGLDRQVGRQGTALSGGERQAVCLARALVSHKRILLFDEPTSAMDLASESAFIGNLVRVLAGRTLLVVTQRPRILQLMERIIVIDKGMIVADGPQKEVMAKFAQAQQSPQKRANQQKVLGDPA
ncbi:MAG: type I secretion system permease/ATPase [Magnetococcales bacterium]|nr:type I secretion system permease/ATPase [Magnetococcales bacterium]